MGGHGEVSLERHVVAAVVVAIAVPVALVGLLAIGLPLLPAVTAVGASALLGVRFVARRLLGRWLDGAARRHRALAVVWLTASAGAVAQNARVAAFIHDPTQTQYSVVPGDADLAEHSCVTAYVLAAALEREGVSNIYRLELYGGLEPPWRSLIGPLQVDPYEYPPTFLPAWIGAVAVTQDFFLLRSLWYVLGAALLAIALVLQARALEAPQRRFLVLAWPLLWVATPVLVGQQFGNTQLLAFALPMLALAAFQLGRARTGAVAFAAIIVGKIFPGILGLELLVRRRWREAAWTTIAGALFVVLALTVVRFETFRDFVDYQLPKLSTGDAFPWMEGDPQRAAGAAAGNLGIYGLVKKLEALGVPGASKEVARIATQVWTLIVLGLAALAARRPGGALVRAQIWLALLTLAAMRSPFAPSDYTTIGTVWFLLLVAAERPTSLRWIASWLSGLVAVSLVESRSLFHLALRADVVVGLIQQVLVLALALWIVLRRREAT